MADTTAAGVSKAELANKYAEGRAKRSRSDGVRRYKEIELGSELEADPFAEVTAPRSRRFRP